MNKCIPCKQCSGRGFISWTFSEGNTGTAKSYVCPDCNGSGFLVVPMTNADRIRSMTDEELAELIVVKVKDIHHQGMRELAYSAWLKWLQQPAEGDDHA